MPHKPNADLLLGKEVAAADAAGEPIVALESTIVCHGMPYPQNVETALAMQTAVRSLGAVPALCAVLDGKLRVGLEDRDIDRLATEGASVAKASRRDLPFLVAAGRSGATTVAATMVLAAMANIRVFATGGIGGVHRGVDATMDVSADLEELANTSVAVVCAGVKSVLDVPKTLEVLETKGVPVIGFGTRELPAFYARTSGLAVDRRLDTAEQVAATMHAKWRMGLAGGLLITVPVPESDALDADEIDAIIDEALGAMRRDGVSGKSVTPYLLESIAERTQGRSLSANIALAVNNARIGAEVAVAFRRLQRNA